MTALPECRWRREETADGRHICLSPKIVSGVQGVPPETCLACPYVDHAPPPRARGQCIHLGRIVGRAPCPVCTQARGEPTSVPLHACAVHGSCTIARHSPGHARCEECSSHCPSWRRLEAGTIRHLTYHVYPRGPIWRWNVVEQLRPRMSLFNGRRIVAVACDGYSDRLEDVQEALAGCDCEYIHVANDQHRREMATHPLLLDRMSDLTSPKDATFYGHGKGVGSGLFADGVAIWAEEMYRGNLDYWPLVRAALRDHGVVGVHMRRRKHPPGVPVDWHYGGSFRWLRNADLYSRDWTRIDQQWLGPETYPALHFGYEEAACLWGEHVTRGWGYSLAEWTRGWRAKASAEFHAQHVADRQTPLLMSVVIRAHQHPERVHEAIASVQGQTSDAWQCLILDSGRIHATGAYDRYRADARIRVVTDPEGPPPDGEPSRAARRCNEAARAGLVRGDLILHLPDDDLLYAQVVEQLIARARAQPNEWAWYGTLDRERIHADGQAEPLPGRPTVGVLRPGNQGRGRIDGMQVCYRRGVGVDWPEDTSAERTADGWWMDAMAERMPIIPLSLTMGRQRHCPESYYTR